MLYFGIETALLNDGNKLFIYNNYKNKIMIIIREPHRTSDGEQQRHRLPCGRVGAGPAETRPLLLAVAGHGHR